LGSATGYDGEAEGETLALGAIKLGIVIKPPAALLSSRRILLFLVIYLQPHVANWDKAVLTRRNPVNNTFPNHKHGWMDTA